MPVNQPIELDIVIILSKRVDQHLGYFQPTDVEAELKQIYQQIIPRN